MNYFLRFKDGKPKALSFSYDDGVTYDIRLVELFNKYGLKGTFNVNSNLFSSNAAHLSSWTNETVTLPIDEDKFYSLLMKKAASSKAKENVVSKVTEDMSSTF